MKQALILIFIMVASCVTIWASGPTTSVAHRPDKTDFSSFETMDWATLEQSLNQEAIDRYALEKKIVAELRLPAKNKQRRLAVIYLAGLNRVGKASRELAEMIDVYYPYPLISHFPPWSEYPAYVALVRIGSPAIPFLIQNLADKDDKKVRELSSSALMEILGYNVATIVLGQASDPAGRPVRTPEELKRLKDSQLLLKSQMDAMVASQQGKAHDK